jgi:hypothetical protein
MTELTTTSPAEQFRRKASGLLVDVAEMELHELVDEFQRLSNILDQNMVEGDDYPKLNDVGELALREQRLVNGAIRARFGLSLETYDRKHNPNHAW